MTSNGAASWIAANRKSNRLQVDTKVVEISGRLGTYRTVDCDAVTSERSVKDGDPKHARSLALDVTIDANGAAKRYRGSLQDDTGSDTRGSVKSNSINREGGST